MNKNKPEERHPLFVLHEQVLTGLFNQPVKILTCMTIGISDPASYAQGHKFLHGWVIPQSANSDKFQPRK